MASFAKLGAPPAIAKALADMGYAEPTEVQARALPPLLAGRDALVQAETGSGKTAAFGVPAVAVGSRASGLRAVILVPTRELARQVADEVRAIGAGSPFRCVAVTGGVETEREERALGGDVRCVVATPGRLLALVEAGRVRLDAVELVVLDEADRMLDMGFRPDVEKALDEAKARKQTVLVSATLPRDVLALAQRHLKDPVEVRATPRAIPEALDHYRLNVFAAQKDDAVVALLRKEAPERAIVFVRTRERAATLTKRLKAEGIAADPLQGDMSHDQRRHVFDLFQRGVTKVLVATDLASRGLDVPEMELVVNADLPDEDEQYLHRAGRAGRMGHAGKVVSLILPEEKPRRMELEDVAGAQFTPYALDVPKSAPQRAGAEPRRPPHQSTGGVKGDRSKRGGPPRRGGGAKGT